MICEHPENHNRDECFAPINAWDVPCNDCPCLEKAKEYLKTPKAKLIYERSKKLLKGLK